MAVMQTVKNHLNSSRSNFVVGQRPASDVCRELPDSFQPLLWGFLPSHFIFLNTQQLHINQDANESQASLGLRSPINFNKQNAQCPLRWLPPFPGLLLPAQPWMQAREWKQGRTKQAGCAQPTEGSGGWGGTWGGSCELFTTLIHYDLS